MRPVSAEIRAVDGAILRGLEWPTKGTAWVAMMHERGADHDLDDMMPLVPSVRRSGASALAVDLRGHGMSDGTIETTTGSRKDIDSIVGWMRERNASMTAIVALRSTCTTVLEAAGELKLDALVLISPPLDSGTDVHALRGAGESKLIVSGGADAGYRDAANQLRNRSVGWAITLLPGTAEQGVEMISGEHGPRIREAVTRFLREQWSIGRQRGASTANMTKGNAT